MLGFVQNWFSPRQSSSRSHPIGVDFGSDSLRLAQVKVVEGEYRIAAAACTDIPSHVRHDPAARFNFFVDNIPELLSIGKFHGRRTILGLPAASMFIQHLRMPKLEPDAMKKALPWELRGKLPIDPSHAILRHVIAGEVYEAQEAKSEVIVIAAAKEMVNQFLAAANKAKLDVIGMNVEPRAVIDCFSQIYRRKSDEGIVNCFVDIGCIATRVTVACGNNILFARTIPVGGDHFSRSTAQALSIKLEDARVLRAKVALQFGRPVEEPKEESPIEKPAEAPAPAIDRSPDNSFALLSAGMGMDRRRTEIAAVPVASAVPELAACATATLEPPADSELEQQARQVEQACSEPVGRLIEELELCRRYYETTFPEHPIQRLVFIGGEARQRALCQSIARKIGLAAQVGDPMARLGKGVELDDETGLDLKLPQPGWAVACGLSMGATDGEATR